MDIEEWKEKLEGAEPDGWCNPGVPCQICQKASSGTNPVEVLSVRRLDRPTIITSASNAKRQAGDKQQGSRLISARSLFLSDSVGSKPGGG